MFYQLYEIGPGCNISINNDFKPPGWIVEWAIHTNRTRSNTVISSVQSNDGGANTPRDAQEQPQEIRRELDDENVGGVEMQEEAKEGGVEERNETILEEGEIAAETETQNKNGISVFNCFHFVVIIQCTFLYSSWTKVGAGTR